MPVYWGIFFLAAITGLFVTKNIDESWEQNKIARVRKYNAHSVWLFWFVLVVFAGFRDRCIDTYMYIVSYSRIPTGMEALKSALEGNMGNAVLWSVLEVVVKTLISEHHYVFFMLVAAITAWGISKGYNEHATNLGFTIFLFVASCAFSWFFNGVRQFMAVAIAFGFSHYLRDGKRIQYLIVIAVVSLIHVSAWVLLPICIFDMTKKPFSKSSVMIAVAVLVMFVMSDTFLPIINQLLETDYDFEEATGAGIVRTLVLAIPVILALINPDAVAEANDSVKLAVNMSMIGCAISLASTFTSGILVGRLPMFYSLYNYYLIPWELDHIFTKENTRRDMKIICIALYTAYFVYQMYVAWGGLQYRSNFFDMDY